MKVIDDTVATDTGPLTKDARVGTRPMRGARRRARASRGLAALGLLAVAAALGCTEKKRTEIVIGLATDLAAPVPLERVNMKAYRLPEQVVIADQDLTISGDPSSLYELPGTFAVYSNTGTPDRVRVVLTALDNAGRTLIVRTAVLSLIPQRTLFVRLGVVSACEDKNDCPTGDTCIGGVCAPEEIDTTRLPDYHPGDEKNVTCAGGTMFTDTVTKQALPLVSTADGGVACAMGTCQEGVCLAPVAGSFTPTAGALAAGKYLTGAVRLNDGKVLRVGGLGPGSVPVVASADVYDPAKRTFSATGSLSVARTGYGETKLADGRVLVVGGINDSATALATAEIYDPKTGLFTPTAGPMTVARTYPTAVTLDDGRVLVVGGANQIQGYSAGNTLYVGGLDSAEIFDPATAMFAATPGHLVEGRVFPHVVAQPGGGALVLCGAFSGALRTSIEKFDGATGTFGATPFAALPAGAPGCQSNVADLQDGRLLITSSTTETWIFDPTTATFATTGPHPVAVPAQMAAVLASGQVLFAGSGVHDQNANANPPASEAYLFNPDTRSFAFVTEGMTVARSYYASALLLSGDVLIAGGDDAGTAEIFHRPGEKPVPSGPASGSGGTGGVGSGTGGHGGGSGSGGIGGGTPAGLVNGSFEARVVTQADTCQGFAWCVRSSDSTPGWTQILDGVDLLQNNFTQGTQYPVLVHASDGVQFLDMNQAGALGGLEQVVAAHPGTTYRLILDTCAWAANSVPGTIGYQLYDPASSVVLANASFTDSVGGTWVTRQLDGVATSGQIGVRIQGLAAHQAGMGLDNVRLLVLPGGGGAGGSGGSGGAGGGRVLPGTGGAGAGGRGGAGGTGGAIGVGATGGGIVTATGGATAGTGGKGGVSGATGGAGGVINSGAVLMPDANGIIAPGSNSFNVQGTWYTYSDGFKGIAGSGDCQNKGGFMASQCSTVSPAPGGAFPNTGGKMCISGVAARVINGTNGMPDYTNIYGAALGFQLNGTPDPTMPTGYATNPYDAVQNGVKGFSFVVDSVPTNGLRVEVTTPGTNFMPASWNGTTSSVSPVVAGTNVVHWTNVGGPMYVTNPPALDPTMLTLIDFLVVTNTTTADAFNFCISNVTLLTQ